MKLHIEISIDWCFGIAFSKRSIALMLGYVGYEFIFKEDMVE